MVATVKIPQTVDVDKAWKDHLDNCVHCRAALRHGFISVVNMCDKAFAIWQEVK